MMTTLEYLQRNWGAAYQITAVHGQWRAVRLDDGETLAAASGEELHSLIIADYAGRPVSRDGGRA